MEEREPQFLSVEEVLLDLDPRACAVMTLSCALVCAAIIVYLLI